MPFRADHHPALNSRFTLLLATGLVLISACADSGPPLLAPDGPRYDIDPDCNIYNPCHVGTIRVVVKRQPEGPIEWPDSIDCRMIPGGCIPIGEPPIFGSGPFSSFTGTFLPSGTANEGSHSATQDMMRRGDIEIAIKKIGEYMDVDCQPIINNLMDRLKNNGIWLFDYQDGWHGGEWVRNERNSYGSEFTGTVYINIEQGTGMNWDANGMVDMRRLRQSLTEEGIHAWFDSDAGHNYGDDSSDALLRMRDACGYYD